MVLCVYVSTCSSLDNSEWMRNGDYIPSRLEAQHDAANLLCGTKTQSNPESTVGVLTMAGKRYVSVSVVLLSMRRVAHGWSPHRCAMRAAVSKCWRLQRKTWGRC